MDLSTLYLFNKV